VLRRHSIGPRHENTRAELLRFEHANMLTGGVGCVGKLSRAGLTRKRSASTATHRNTSSIASSAVIDPSW
jgi:hypothetical protein